MTPEPLPLTQGGNPVPQLQLAHFGVYLSDMTPAADEAVAAPDPLTNWLETFLTLSEEDDLLQHLHCQDLFQGIGKGDGCYATVRQWLQEIWEDNREHREVAADSRFTTRTLLPKPFEISLRAVARKEGWETETLMAPFLGNIGWMESPGVRLRLREDEEHKRSCVVQVVCAGEPSMRKSSLKDFAAKTLLSHADVPETLRTGQRSMVHRRHRQGHPWLHPRAQSSWPRVRRDRQHLRRLKPTESMFAKRIHATWQMRPVHSDPNQQTEHSRQFLIDFFGWLGRHASSDVRDHDFDGFAYTLFRNVQRAIEDFIETVGRVPEASQHKLRYHDTDICRYANASCAAVSTCAPPTRADKSSNRLRWGSRWMSSALRMLSTFGVARGKSYVLVNRSPRLILLAVTWSKGKVSGVMQGRQTKQRGPSE